MTLDSFLKGCEQHRLSKGTFLGLKEFLYPRRRDGMCIFFFTNDSFMRLFQALGQASACPLGAMQLARLYPSSPWKTSVGSRWEVISEMGLERRVDV